MSKPSEKWEPPAHLSVGDVQFLSERKETIENIRAASALMQGRVLLQVKRRFASDVALNEWFYPWAFEATGVSKSQVEALVACAEQAESNPAVAEALNSNAANSVYRALGLPRSVREAILKRMSEGEKISMGKITEMKALPEVELEAAEESVGQLEDLVNTWRLRQLSADTQKDKKNARECKDGAERRLTKAKQRLQELREQNSSLEVKMTAQEAVLHQLSRQLKESQVRHEQATQDPVEFINRSRAKAVVEAEKSITDTLAALERLSADLDELTPQARKSLQLKLDKLNAVITTLNTEVNT
jgi:myosin heavy subunit